MPPHWNGAFMSRAEVRDFLAGRREITIGDDGDPDPLTVVYRPGRINAEYQKRIRELADDGQSQHAVMVFSICTLVSEWDLKGPLIVERPVLDGKGKPIRDAYGVDRTEEVELVKAGDPIPLRSEFVKYLATPLLLMIAAAIGEDMAPDPKASMTS